MIIGIPKEILAGENRVAATPETLAKYRQLGFTVLVHDGAGRGAFIDLGMSIQGAVSCQAPAEGTVSPAQPQKPSACLRRRCP